MWTFLRQHQQRGAQLHAREGRAKASGDAPKEAIEGREAQDHDYADLDVGQTDEPQRDIDYPATNPTDREGDITPSEPEVHVEWDEVVQPERQEQQGSELEQDERGDDPEQTVSAERQQEQWSQASPPDGK